MLWNGREVRIDLSCGQILDVIEFGRSRCAHWEGTGYFRFDLQWKSMNIFSNREEKRNLPNGQMMSDSRALLE